jgi:hypothetical protein
MSRTAIIGDIHGCIVEFKELIDRLALQPGDRVVCLGDFMDKGPYPAECVRYARLMGFESVISNHEERHLRWRQHEALCRVTGKKNPMRAMTEEDAAANAALSDEDIAWLTNLPVTIDLGDNWVAVHGGFLPEVSVADQHPNDVIRMRWVGRRDGRWGAIATDYSTPETLMAVPENGYHWTEVWDGYENVVYGHEAFSLSKPKVTRIEGVQTWGIDTGAAHGGHLTALILPTLEVVQVKAKAKYCEVVVPIPE